MLFNDDSRIKKLLEKIVDIIKGQLLTDTTEDANFQNILSTCQAPAYEVE